MFAKGDLQALPRYAQELQDVSEDTRASVQLESRNCRCSLFVIGFLTLLASVGAVIVLSTGIAYSDPFAIYAGSVLGVLSVGFAICMVVIARNTYKDNSESRLRLNNQPEERVTAETLCQELLLDPEHIPTVLREMSRENYDLFVNFILRRDPPAYPILAQVLERLDHTEESDGVNAIVWQSMDAFLSPLVGRDLLAQFKRWPEMLAALVHHKNLWLADNLLNALEELLEGSEREAFIETVSGEYNRSQAEKVGVIWLTAITHYGDQMPRLLNDIMAKTPDAFAYANGRADAWS